MKNGPQKNYLPSKQFIKKIIVIFVLLSITLIITKIIPSVRQNLKENKLAKSLLVKDLVIQDQNANGIQDWEEALWGLDPNTDGESNREYIMTKKRLLNKDSIPEGDLTEDEKMTREFFALIVSLQQSGNLNEESMKNLAESISSEVQIIELPDIYTDKTLKIDNTTTATLRSYYENFKKIGTKYQDKGIGEELLFIGQAIANSDPEALRIAMLTVDDYRSFGQDLMNMTVPTSLVVLHLELANGYEKNAISLEQMSGMLDNPTKGMTAFIKYKKYNDSLVTTIDKMALFFKKSGIIK